MSTIKSFTDLKQSKKLAEILPIESADMFYKAGNDAQPTFRLRSYGHIMSDKDVCAWSLAALLEQLPYELCDDDGNSAYLQINKEDDMYQLAYEDPYGDFDNIETDRHEHFVDACVAMIESLHELNLL